MKKFHLYFSLIIAILLSGSTQNLVNAQVQAGVLPVGAYSIDPGIDLATANNAEAVDSIDLNCDNVADIYFHLISGPLEIDGSNILYIEQKNPAIQICADTLPAYGNFVNLYNAGDFLNCSGAYDWSSDTVLFVAMYGGFSTVGLPAMTDAFFAYSLNGQTGWVKFSYDLNGTTSSDTISFSEHEYMTYCNPNSVGEIDNAAINIFPSPTNDGILKIQTEGKLEAVTIYNSVGQLIEKLNGDVREVMLPSVSGVYFLQLEKVSGAVFNKKIIRY
jgi:hypothetical protein